LSTISGRRRVLRKPGRAAALALARPPPARAARYAVRTRPLGQPPGAPTSRQRASVRPARHVAVRCNKERPGNASRRSEARSPGAGLVAWPRLLEFSRGLELWPIGL